MAFLDTHRLFSLRMIRFEIERCGANKRGRTGALSTASAQVTTVLLHHGPQGSAAALEAQPRGLDFKSIQLTCHRQYDAASGENRPKSSIHAVCRRALSRFQDKFVLDKPTLYAYYF
jgi:hypothetical protein